MRFVKQIFVRNSPTANKNWIFEVFLVNHGLKSIAHKKTIHVIKVRLAAINKLSMIALVAK